MSRDAHRAPSRLSPPRQVNGRGAPVPSRSHRPRHAFEPGSSPSRPEWSDPDPGQDWTPASSGTGSGTHRFDDPPDAEPNEDVRNAIQSRVFHAEEYSGEPGVDRVAEQSARTVELSKHDRTKLLIDTIQLFDDVWKLASIRANERHNWMVAYLTPRKKPNMDLRTAISKRQVLVITIDEMGNTDIREPQKRRLWQRLTAWLIGE